MDTASQSLLQAAWESRRSGDAAAALAQAELAMQANGLSEDLAARAEILCAVGQFHRDLSAVELAREAYATAAEEFRLAGDRRGLAHALRHQGEIEGELGRLDAAAGLLKEALKLYSDEESAAPLTLANSERALAVVHEARGETAEAARLWLSAYKHYSAAGVAAGIEECEARLSAYKLP